MGNDHGQLDYGWKNSSSSDCHSYVVPSILKLIPGNKLKILDAGCGNGFLANQLASRGHQVVGIDLSEDGILLAKNNYFNIHFEKRSIYEDLHDLGTDFDLIISSEVIEHLYYPQKFLNNIWSILRPEGYLILSTPYHGWLKNSLIGILGLWDKHHTADWEGGHIKFFSVQTIKESLLKSGYSNIVFNNAGRIRWLWKSMVVRAQKI